MVFNKKQKGETLIEVITALTALVLAGVASVTVIISVMHSNAISKEYLIAQNLAREGIEGVISIRNTNWLKHPSDKKTKWLCIDPQDGGCQSVSATGHYILNRIDLSQGFYLKDKSPAVLDLSDALDDEFKLILKSYESAKIYTHNSGEDTNPEFYRMITFEKVDDSPDSDEKYKVTVSVQWLNKSKPSKYELTSIITNYAK